MKPLVFWMVLIAHYTFSAGISDSVTNRETGIDPSKQKHLEALRKDFNSSNVTYKLGYWMTVGGLIACFTPELSGVNDSGQFDGLMGLGGISFLVGIPLMGVGANRMSGIAKSLDSGYVQPNSGWLYYGLAKGVQLAGISMMVVQGLIDASSIVVAIGGAGDTTPPSQTWGNLAAIPLVASVGLELFSWYKFSRLRHSAIASVDGKGRLKAYIRPVISRRYAGRLMTGADVVIVF